MIITKHGKTAEHESVEFICSKCGCVFSATFDEYYIDKGSAFSSLTTTNYVYRSTVTDYLVCSCPECHKIVVNKEERTIENPTISLSGSTSARNFVSAEDFTSAKEDAE